MSCGRMSVTSSPESRGTQCSREDRLLPANKHADKIRYPKMKKLKIDVLNCTPKEKRLQIPVRHLLNHDHT